MRKGGITAVNCTVSVWEGFQKTVDNIATMKQSIRDNADLLTLVRTTDDIRQGEEPRARPASFSASRTPQRSRTISAISRRSSDMGVSVVQLCYNTQNLIGTGCYERDGGLSGYGHEVIARR